MGTTRRTLFDPRAYRYGLADRDEQPSYISDIRRASAEAKDARESNEPEIFNALAEQEIGLTEGALHAIGPLTCKIAGKSVDLSKRSIHLGGWVEDDRLRFLKCEAKGILLIEKGVVYTYLQKEWRHLGMLVTTGNGIPGTTARRVLHRLAEELRLPVYVLSDCDTWGYFLFSILKRGMIAPHICTPQLAVKDARYLGVRARDAMQLPQNLRIPWRLQWNLRLRAMAQYRCFKSKAWQNEFKAFRSLGGKLEMEAVYHRATDSDARRFVQEYLKPKLRDGDWLQ